MSEQLHLLSLESQNLRRASAAHVDRARTAVGELRFASERSAILIANSLAILARLRSFERAARGTMVRCEEEPSRDLLSVVEQLKIRRSTTFAGGAAPIVYVGFFWDDRLQGVTFQFTSDDLIQAITLAYDHLRKVRIEDSHLKTFLLDRLQSWDGEGAHMTMVADGKLTLFSTRFGSVVAEVPAAREDWFRTRLAKTQSAVTGRQSPTPP